SRLSRLLPGELRCAGRRAAGACCLRSADLYWPVKQRSHDRCALILRETLRREHINEQMCDSYSDTDRNRLRQFSARTIPLSALLCSESECNLRRQACEPRLLCRFFGELRATQSRSACADSQPTTLNDGGVSHCKVCDCRFLRIPTCFGENKMNSYTC